MAAGGAGLGGGNTGLGTGEYFCTIIEPRQSEGGDRDATERFDRAVRLLTRHHKTFLVFDEVQVGFGLGGDHDLGGEQPPARSQRRCHRERRQLQGRAEEVARQAPRHSVRGRPERREQQLGGAR